LILEGRGIGARRPAFGLEQHANKGPFLGPLQQVVTLWRDMGRGLR